MEVTLCTERDVATEATNYAVPFTVSQTNEDILKQLLKRQLLDIRPGKSTPLIQSESITNSQQYPEIKWEEMSCYLDAIVLLLVQPQFDNLLQTTITYKKHAQKELCGDNIERVRDTWRQTIFLLLQKRRVSLRPFLRTLQDCEETISPDTPFWTTCLNDPLEFMKNVFVPILSVKTDTILQGMYRELIKYETVEDQEKVENKIMGTSDPSKPYDLQILNVNMNEIANGEWFTSPDVFYSISSEFARSPPVFITKKTWEYNGTRRVFIQNKGKEDEREVPLSERTDEIGSQIVKKTSDITPFHPRANILMIGIQSIDPSQKLEDVPLQITKGSSTWNLQGSIIFSNGHYTAIYKDIKRNIWIDYDTMQLPVEITEDKAIEIMKDNVRCLVYMQ